MWDPWKHSGTPTEVFLRWVLERLLDLEAAEPSVILSLLLASCVSYSHTFDDLSLSEKWKQNILLVKLSWEFPFPLWKELSLELSIHLSGNMSFLSFTSTKSWINFLGLFFPQRLILWKQKVQRLGVTSNHPSPVLDAPRRNFPTSRGRLSYLPPFLPILRPLGRSPERAETTEERLRSDARAPRADSRSQRQQVSKCNAISLGLEFIGLGVISLLISAVSKGQSAKHPQRNTVMLLRRFCVQ